MYMASGYVPSDDGHELYFYSSGQAFTHGGDGQNHSWGNQTGIRRLTVRRDGFVSVNAPYTFPTNRSQLPALTTVEVTVRLQLLFVTFLLLRQSCQSVVITLQPLRQLSLSTRFALR